MKDIIITGGSTGKGEAAIFFCEDFEVGLTNHNFTELQMIKYPGLNNKGHYNLTRLGVFNTIPKSKLSFKIRDRNFEIYKGSELIVNRHLKELRGGMGDIMYYKGGVSKFLGEELGIKKRA